MLHMFVLIREVPMYWKYVDMYLTGKLYIHQEGPYMLPYIFLMYKNLLTIFAMYRGLDNMSVYFKCVGSIQT